MQISVHCVRFPIVYTGTAHTWPRHSLYKRAPREQTGCDVIIHVGRHSAGGRRHGWSLNQRAQGRLPVGGGFFFFLQNPGVADVTTRRHVTGGHISFILSTTGGEGGPAKNEFFPRAPA